jgi:hypothetical protein
MSDRSWSAGESSGEHWGEDELHEVAGAWSVAVQLIAMVFSVVFTFALAVLLLGAAAYFLLSALATVTGGVAYVEGVPPYFVIGRQ